MKRIYFRTPVLLMLILAFITGNKLSSQTTGNFNFSVNTTSTGGFSPEHLIAIWVENNSTAFVKTKIKYSSPDNYDHLSTWTGKSGENVTDATTGETLTQHGTISFLWDGTDVLGSEVTDGTYNIWLEMAWAHGGSSGKTVSSYSFTKGPNVVSLTPANTANFQDVTLTWTPSISTSIEKSMQDNNIRVFPNPTSGLLNIDFKQAATQGCIVKVINDAGIEVYNESLSYVPEGIRTFDLSVLSPGAYYVTLQMPGRIITFRIILMK